MASFKGCSFVLFLASTPLKQQQEQSDGFGVSIPYKQWDWSKCKRVHSVGGSPAIFWVLLAGEFLHGLSTRWKLSWRYELAGSFPVRRPGVNQARRNAPCSPTSSFISVLFFFFFTASLLVLTHLADQLRNTHFSPPPFPPQVSVLLSSILYPCFVEYMSCSTLSVFRWL